MLIKIEYTSEPINAVMFVGVEIIDGGKNELILFEASTRLREELVPFLLSFEAK